MTFNTDDDFKPTKPDERTVAESLVLAREFREIFKNQIRPILIRSGENIDTDAMIDMINRIIWGMHQIDRPERLPVYNLSPEDRLMLHKSGIREHKLDSITFIKK